MSWVEQSQALTPPAPVQLFFQEGAGGSTEKLPGRDTPTGTDDGPPPLQTRELKRKSGREGEAPDAVLPSVPPQLPAGQEEAASMAPARSACLDTPLWSSEFFEGLCLFDESGEQLTEEFTSRLASRVREIVGQTNSFFFYDACIHDLVTRIQARVLPGGTGIRSLDSVADFVIGMATLQAQWPQLTEAERLAEMLVLVNEALVGAGVPKIERIIITEDSLIGAAFFYERWHIEIMEAFVAKTSLNDQDTLVLAGLLYHEARHAEQFFRVLCLLATTMEEGELRAHLASQEIPDHVLELALVDPLNLESASEDVIQQVEEARLWGEGHVVLGLEQYTELALRLFDAMHAVDQQLHTINEALDVLEAMPTATNLSELCGQLVGLESRITQLRDSFDELHGLSFEADAWEAQVVVMEYLQLYQNWLHQQMGVVGE